MSFISLDILKYVVNVRPAQTVSLAFSISKSAAYLTHVHHMVKVALRHSVVWMFRLESEKTSKKEALYSTPSLASLSLRGFSVSQ